MYGASSTQFSTILQLYKIIHLHGVLFNGLPVELPTILNSFFTNTTSDYIRRGNNLKTPWIAL